LRGDHYYYTITDVLGFQTAQGSFTPAIRHLEICIRAAAFDANAWDNEHIHNSIGRRAKRNQMLVDPPADCW